MNDVPREELISAYLDDEVTPEERERVEALLASDAPSRQLYEELRALRQSLQSLPAETLEDDFSQRVLRRAEQAMLATPASAAAHAEPPPAAAFDRRRWYRPLLWSGAAIAAALLLTFLLPDDAGQPGGVDLAQRPPAAGEVAAAPEGEISAKGGRPAGEPESSFFADDAANAAAAMPAETATSAAAPLSKGGASGAFGIVPMPTAAAPAGADEKDAVRNVDLSSDDQLLIVTADVSAEAVRDGGPLDEVFTRNNVAWGAAAKQPVPAIGLQLQTAEPGRDNVAGASNGIRCDVVYVEVEPTQVESLLADMSSRPEAFLSVDVDPAPAIPTQARFRSYNRANFAAAPTIESSAADQRREEAATGPRMREAAPDRSELQGRVADDDRLDRYRQVAPADRPAQAGLTEAEQNAERTLEYRARNGRAQRLVVTPDVIDSVQMKQDASRVEQALQRAGGLAQVEQLKTVLRGADAEAPAQRSPVELRADIQALRAQGQIAAEAAQSPVRALFVLRVHDTPAGAAATPPRPTPPDER